MGLRQVHLGEAAGQQGARPAQERGLTIRRVWIGLGANVGDPPANVREAVRRLARLPGVEVEAVSSLYATAPWGKTDQSWFVNAVAAARTDLPPPDLLAMLLRLETEMGRVRHERWGPRTLDLDYLLDEAGPTAANDLTVPHPELENRAFVLAPLAELEPDLVLPSGRPIASRLAELLVDQPLRLLEPAPTIAPCRPPSSR